MIDSLANISALSLFVEDVQLSKAFYTDVFGVAVVYEDDVSAVVKFDNLLINLLQVSQASGLIEEGRVGSPDSGARFQLSIWVADVDSVYDELTMRGIPIASSPVNTAWGMRTITLVDPAGNSWEIAQDLKS